MTDPANELVIRFKMDLESATGEFVAGASGIIRIDQERTKEAMDKAGIPLGKQLAMSQHLITEAWMHLARMDEYDDDGDELEAEQLGDGPAAAK